VFSQTRDSLLIVWVLTGCPAVYATSAYSFLHDDEMTGGSTSDTEPVMGATRRPVGVCYIRDKLFPRRWLNTSRLAQARKCRLIDGSRRNFYAQIARRSFHAAKTQNRKSRL
jgi:hypothetical protein